MILARVLSKIYKEVGIILVDPKGQKYICGNPRSEKPITLKILKESLPTKGVLDKKPFIALLVTCFIWSPPKVSSL